MNMPMTPPGGGMPPGGSGSPLPPGSYLEGLSNLTPEQMNRLDQKLDADPELVQLLGIAFPEAAPLLAMFEGPQQPMQQPAGVPPQPMPAGPPAGQPMTGGGMAQPTSSAPPEQTGFRKPLPRT